MRLAFLLLLLPAMACAASTDRENIHRERQVIQQEYAVQEKACQARFAVTDCVEEVRARKRKALAPLRERELQLDAADRQQRASERQAAVAAKKQAAAERPEPAPPVQPRLRKSSPVPSGHIPVAPPPVDPTRATEAAARARDAESRKAAAKQTQDRIAKRLAERAQQGKLYKPLPVPGAASASSSAGAGASAPAR